MPGSDPGNKPQQSRISPAMPLKLLLTLAIAMIMAGSASLAADRKGNFAIWGVGASSCNQYNKARLDGQDKGFRSYISGYFTHYNMITPQTVNIAGAMDITEVLGLMDEICTEKPVLSFNDALGILVEQLYQERQRHR